MAYGVHLQRATKQSRITYFTPACTKHCSHPQPNSNFTTMLMAEDVSQREATQRGRS